jgi:hypothetical protein
MGNRQEKSKNRRKQHCSMRFEWLETFRYYALSPSAGLSTEVLASVFEDHVSDYDVLQIDEDTAAPRLILVERLPNGDEQTFVFPLVDEEVRVIRLWRKRQETTQQPKAIMTGSVLSYELSDVSRKELRKGRGLLTPAQLLRIAEQMKEKISEYVN